MTATVVRRTTLTERPNSDVFDAEGLRVPTEEEMELRLQVCREMMSRESRRLSGPGYPLEEALADATFGVYQAARHDEFYPQISLEGYSAFWVRHALRRALASRKRVVRIPARDLGWVCGNARCSLLLVQQELKEMADGTPCCPLCGAPAAKNVPPTCLSIDAPVNPEGDVREILAARPEHRAEYERIVGALTEAAQSEHQKRILKEIVVEGKGQQEIAAHHGVTRQLVNMSLAKMKGRALEVLMAEDPDLTEQMLGRENVATARTAHERLERKAREGRERREQRKREARAKARGQTPQPVKPDKTWPWPENTHRVEGLE